MLADFLEALDGPVLAQEQNVNGTGVGAAVVVERRADGQIRNAVAVEITQSANRITEQITRSDIAAEVARKPADLLLVFDGAVLSHEENPNRARVCKRIVGIGCADGEIGHAVFVEVTYDGHRRAELVAESERSAEIAE